VIDHARHRGREITRRESGALRLVRPNAETFGSRGDHALKRVAYYTIRNRHVNRYLIRPKSAIQDAI
jgi:hypothetical protein